MAEKSPGTGDPDESDTPGADDHQSDSVPQVIHLPQPQPTATPPHHIFTALSIEKSPIIDQDCIKYLKEQSWYHNYYCVICRKLMLKPLSIRRCAHNICEICFGIQLKKGGEWKSCSLQNRGPESHIGLKEEDVKIDTRLMEEIHRVEIYCPNKRGGCQVVLKISFLKEHLLVCIVAKQALPTIDDIARNLFSSATTPQGSSHQTTDTSSILLPLVSILQTMSMKVKSAKEENATLKTDLKKCDDTNTSLRETIKKLESGRKHLEQETEDLKAKVGKNNDEVNRLKLSASQAEAWRASVSPRDPQRTEKLLQQVDVLHTTLNDMDLRLQCIENASYDGKLVWKISFFDEHLERAERGDVESLYSQPFYDAVRGYKMCCRLYPRGKGPNRGTHLSLYFVLMRGTYDELQTWPFTKTVELTIKNFTSPEGGPQKHDITRHIIPDADNRSFRRPKTEMNFSVGIPDFLPIDDIRYYMKDHVVYVHCEVKSNAGAAP